MTRQAKRHNSPKRPPRVPCVAFLKPSAHRALAATARVEHRSPSSIAAETLAAVFDADFDPADYRPAMRRKPRK